MANNVRLQSQNRINIQHILLVLTGLSESVKCLAKPSLSSLQRPHRTEKGH